MLRTGERRVSGLPVDGLSPAMSAKIERELQSILRDEHGKEKPADKQVKVEGEGFMQLKLGVPLMTQDGKKVWKYTSVNYNVPGMLIQNGEVLNEIIARMPLLANLSGNIVDYTPEGTMAGFFASSKGEFNNGYLELFRIAHEVIGEAVRAHRDEIPEKRYESFFAEHDDRHRKREALDADTIAILTNPEHGGEHAYRNIKLLAKKDRRMALIREDGVVMTPAPPKDNYKMWAFDENLAEEGSPDRKLMIALLEAMKHADESSAGVFIGMQFNSSKTTVHRCGGADDETIFVNAAPHVIVTGIQNPAALTQEEIAPAQASQEQPQAGQSQQQAVQTAQTHSQAQQQTGQNGESGSAEKNSCPNCGKAQEGERRCSCRTMQQHMIHAA